MRKLYMNLLGREKRIAVEEETQIVEIISIDEYSESIVGNIYLGRVIDVIAGLNAAFVDIGVGQKGYIHRDDLLAYRQSTIENKEKKNISSFVRQGEAIIVQVVKEAIEHKGPKLTGIVELPGYYVVYSPYRNKIKVSGKLSKQEGERWNQYGEKLRREHEGLIFRTSCEHQSFEDVELEIRELRQKYELIKKWTLTETVPFLLEKEGSLAEKIVREMGIQTISEIVVDDFEVYEIMKRQYSHKNISLLYYNKKENVFSYYGIEAELDKALKRIVELENGANITIDHTEALTIIDVNTGKFSGKTEQRDTVLKTNELAAKEIARQLRLRDIGGMILIDFINMSIQDDRQRVIDALRASLNKDRSSSVLYGFTRLGIFELTRKKIKPNLMHLMTQTCAVCKGTGRAPSPDALSVQLERELLEYRGGDYEAIWVEANKEIINIFQQQKTQLEETLKFKIIFTEAEALAYHIRHMGTMKEIRQRLDHQRREKNETY